MAKKIVGDFEEEKEVEPPKAVKVREFVAIAPFELQLGYKVLKYKAGDTFKVPEDWQRDTSFEEFRKNKNGVVFTEPVPVLDEKGKLKYMDSRRVILPLKEV